MFENEKTNNVEELGNKKLDLNIKYPEVDKGNNIRILDGTIKDFLKKICITYRYSFTGYDKQIHFFEMEALNKNQDKKIEQIVDYVVNAETLPDNDSDKDGKNSSLFPNFEVFLELSKGQKQTAATLLFKKTYIILQIIRWGMNPFEIRKCLKSSGNDNFNWEKFLECVMDSQDILRVIGSEDSWLYRSAVDIIRYMYFFEPLFTNSKNLSERLKPFDFKFLLPKLHNCSWLTEDVGMPFIIEYLNELGDNEQNNKMKSYLLNIPHGYLWKNFLLRVLDDKFFGIGVRKKYKEQVNKIESREDSMINLSHLMVDNIKFDFEEKNFEEDGDFWDLISNLNKDPVMISFFVLVAMRKISFTQIQMDSIARQINNQQVIDTLREINCSLDFKPLRNITNQYNLIRAVRFGSITAFLDYAFLKISRGLGYLGAALYDGLLCVCVMSVSGSTVYSITYWIFLTNFTLYTTTFWIVASILSGAVALLCFLYFIVTSYDFLKFQFKEFADGMEEFYNNGKIVYWLESYNIKHPTNKIGEPPAEINTGMPSGPGQGSPEINSNDGPVINTDNDINASLQSK